MGWTGATMRFAATCAALCLATRLGAQPDSGTSRREPWNAARLSSGPQLYKGLGYGSDAYNSPLTVLLNKGFDIFQLRYSARNVWTFPYTRAWDISIRDVVRKPGPIIREYGGWGRFSRLELIPSSTNVDDWNWAVNYTEHLLGGGMTMRMLDEWYRAHGVPLPRLFAITTTYAASILNEMTEQPIEQTATGGTLADLLIFDVGAIALFNWRQPTHFFAHTLQLADWSNLASFTFPNRQLQNNGQYLTMKVPIGLNRTRLFLRGGMGAQLGVSRKLGDEHHLSVGFGGVTNLRTIDKTGHELVSFAPGGGVYFDRNNSLLWSLTASPAENSVAINVYPGILPGALRDVGVWAVDTRQHQFRIGIVHRRALGLGVGYGR